MSCHECCDIVTNIVANLQQCVTSDSHFSCNVGTIQLMFTELRNCRKINIGVLCYTENSSSFWAT